MGESTAVVGDVSTADLSGNLLEKEEFFKDIVEVFEATELNKGKVDVPKMRRAVLDREADINWYDDDAQEAGDDTAIRRDNGIVYQVKIRRWFSVRRTLHVR